MLPVISSMGSKESWTLSDKLGWHQKGGPRRELLVTIAKLHQGYLKKPDNSILTLGPSYQNMHNLYQCMQPKNGHSLSSLFAMWVQAISVSCH